MELISIADLPRECIEDCTRLGQAADGPVAHWRDDPRVKPIIDALDPNAMRRCLKGYGAWDADELADDEENRQRILWLARGDFREYIAECKHANVDPFGERPDDLDSERQLRHFRPGIA